MHLIQFPVVKRQAGRTLPQLDMRDATWTNQLIVIFPFKQLYPVYLALRLADQLVHKQDSNMPEFKTINNVGVVLHMGNMALLLARMETVVMSIVMPLMFLG